jgi:hypothetical protein
LQREVHPIRLRLSAPEPMFLVGSGSINGSVNVACGGHCYGLGRAPVDVRFTPKATELLRRRKMQRCAIRVLVAPQQEVPLLDHLVGAHEQRRRYVKAERFRRFEVEGCFVFDRYLNWKVSRRGATQDAIDVGCRLPK